LVGCLIAVATAIGNGSDGSEIVFLMVTDAFIPISSQHQQKNTIAVLKRE
jgi:hypothetical protein